MAVVVVVLQHVLAESDRLERVVVSSVAGAVTYVAALALLDRPLLHEAQTIVRDLFSRVRT
jgi:hypothetical protein